MRKRTFLTELIKKRTYSFVGISESDIGLFCLMIFPHWGSHGYGLAGYRIQQSLWWAGSSRRATMAMGLPQRSQRTSGLGWMTTGGGVGMWRISCSTWMRVLALACNKPKSLTRRNLRGNTCLSRSHKNSAPGSRAHGVCRYGPGRRSSQFHPCQRECSAPAIRHDRDSGQDMLMPANLGPPSCNVPPSHREGFHYIAGQLLSSLQTTWRETHAPEPAQGIRTSPYSFAVATVLWLHLKPR
jgi:hypothetical protein